MSVVLMIPRVDSGLASDARALHSCRRKIGEAGEVAEARLGMSAMGKHRAKLFDARPGPHMPPAIHGIGMDGHKAVSEFARVAASGLSYQWKVPNIGSSQCLLRVRVAEMTSATAIKTFAGHNAYINSSCFDKTGERIATNSDDNTTRIWSVATGATLVTLVGHTGDVYWSEFSSDGSKIVTGSDDGTARIWDASTGHVTTDPEWPHNNSNARCVSSRWK